MTAAPPASTPPQPPAQPSVQPGAPGSPAPLDLNALTLPELHRALAAPGRVRRLFELARDEDLGLDVPLAFRGDVTSAVSVDESSHCAAKLVARRAGVVGGLAWAPDLIGVFSPRVRFEAHQRDGAAVPDGAALGLVVGPTRDVLSLERTLLNVVGRLCGIATRTAAFVRAAGSDTRARVFDTRKTTPGLRALEKYAVRCGGGLCHRQGLYDAVLIKDNHIAGVTPERLGERVARAARRARELNPALAFVEAEVDSIDQLRALLALPPGTVDIILLDNMTPSLLAECVRARDAVAQQRPGVPALEASGGVTLETVRAIAQTGVERISVGSLTHGAASLDVALDLDGGSVRAGQA